MVKLRKLTNRNTCFDIFQKTEVNGVRIYCEKPIQNVIDFKMKREYMTSLYEKMKLVSRFQSLKGVTYLELILKRIELIKELFLLNIAQGDEVVIPDELSQKTLPASYYFYDAIMNIIQKGLEQSKKQFFAMKRKLTLERIHEENFERKLFEKIGMRHPLETKQHENIIFKKGMVTTKEENEIDHNKCGNSMCLQSSQYLKIETDFEYAKQQYMHMNTARTQENQKEFEKIRSYNGLLNLRFMHERDVEKRQKMFLIFKSQFFAKLNQMESNGKNQDVLVKLYKYIENNLDQLYEKH